MEALLKKKDDWTESASELSSCNSGESKEGSNSSSSSRSSSGNLVDKVKVNKARVSGSGSASASPPSLLGWPIRRAIATTTTPATVSKNSDVSDGNGDEDKISNEDDKFKKLSSKINEIDMMEERFAKLLLGEDMSGSGKGVCTALAISNAITNLCATIFGQLWRLEPIHEEKKSMWKREMEWLVSVSDHIVELIPSWQNFPAGSKLEPPINPNQSTTKSSWEMVKDLMVDGDQRELLAERAENLLLCLKQRFPGLTQTALDTSKIQCNKDVGKSILESYSRVLESLAYNIVARIDDLLYVDDLTKHSEKLASVPTVSVIAHKKVSIPYSVPASSSPYKTAITTPSFSPAPLISPAKGERTPFLKENNNNNTTNNNSKPHRRGFGVKRVLTNYLGVDSKAKLCGNPTDGSSILNSNSTESSGNQKDQVISKQSSAYQNRLRMRQNPPRYTVT
ncbi:rop guanine nucleotide exchange factor 5-like isoform X1 [Durio zibethinus]|uniref:Rop guanine nucleotide exchange factor 5-like isoform X1 n=1 Tax=Durio zibethinus TaxID=66656 RepID=A0A6P5YY11_DURZI|nr:rop guanine nucleotide exchange factor 5-like isoform X1 [Durio zibethinus]